MIKDFDHEKKIVDRPVVEIASFHSVPNRFNPSRVAQDTLVASGGCTSGLSTTPSRNVCLNTVPTLDAHNASTPFNHPISPILNRKLIISAFVLNIGLPTCHTNSLCYSRFGHAKHRASRTSVS